MPITKFQFKPGVNKDITSYSNEGGWFASDKVRFVEGYPETIGGWTKRNASYSFLGTGRSLFPWQTLAGTRQIGLGTNSKFYVDRGGFFYDITPLRLTTSAGDATFAATTGSSTLTVTETAHNALKGDFVTFSGAVTLGGLITADVINQEYEIDTVTDANIYTVEAREEGTTIASITVDGALVPVPVLANASDTGDGGASVVAAYQINGGLNTAIYGTGWGSSTWGRAGFGSAATSTGFYGLRLWYQDNYGEDLVFNAYNDGIYYWDQSADVYGTDRATAISDLPGVDAYAPTVASQVLVSNDRHVIVFGCDPEDDIGTQDPLLIRWCNQENILVWQTTVDNSVGDLRISSGSLFVTAVETRRQILVFTDKSLSAMQFIGPPYTFGINVISENTTILSANAAVAVDDAVFWMGVGGFQVYTGQATQLESTVDKYVYDDLNEEQAGKVFAALNQEFTEVWWFYPGTGSSEVNKYVIFNYKTGIWTLGTMVRTAWASAGVDTNPVATGTDGYVYVHESGLDDGSTNPVSAISSSIESSQIDIGDGDHFMFIDRLIPDISFSGSTSDAPTATMTLQTRNYPGGAYLQSNDSSVVQSASSPVELFTTETQVRLRGRSVSLKVTAADAGTKWRLGSPRVNIRQDGKR
tara:strand:+ start:21509 stop:23434 length:1926 start_codon:yes stop_codon:yes gene_type:complete